MTQAITARAGVRGADGGARLFWLDNLRALLIALVLLHHSALTYSHLPMWTYYEVPSDASAYGLDALLLLNQMWFMGMFFLVSGYFVPASVDRHGVASFVRGRLIRLGAPLVFFIVVLQPLFVLPAWRDEPDRGGLLSYLFTNINLGPLWFVLVLLIFSLGYAALRAMADDREIPAGTAPVSLRGVGMLGLGLGLLTFVWRILTPDGSYWPIVGLPTPSYLPQYLLCFALGCLAARRQWLGAIGRRVAVVSAVLAVVCVLAYAAAGAAYGEAIAGGANMGALAGAVTISLGAAFTMTAVLAASRNWLNGTGPVRKFLSDNAFAVYVVHAPVLAMLGMALAGWSAPAFVKALGLWILGAGASWLLAYGIRRVPAARRVF